MSTIVADAIGIAAHATSEHEAAKQYWARRNFEHQQKRTSQARSELTKLLVSTFGASGAELEVVSMERFDVDSYGYRSDYSYVATIRLGGGANTVKVRFVVSHYQSSETPYHYWGSLRKLYVDAVEPRSTGRRLVDALRGRSARTIEQELTPIQAATILSA